MNSIDTPTISVVTVAVLLAKMHIPAFLEGSGISGAESVRCRCDLDVINKTMSYLWDGVSTSFITDRILMNRVPP